MGIYGNVIFYVDFFLDSIHLYIFPTPDSNLERIYFYYDLSTMTLKNKNNNNT